ncbi:MAG: 50S ribosomal protein L29 [archaeon]
MASVKAKELRELPLEELEEKITLMKSELSKEKAQISSGTKAENPGKIKKIRKEIARTFTVINEKTHSKKEPEEKNTERKTKKSGKKHKTGKEAKKHNSLKTRKKKKGGKKQK